MATAEIALEKLSLKNDIGVITYLNPKRLLDKLILLFTSENSAKMKQKARELGMTGWRVKPLNEPKMVTAISLILGL